MRLLRSSIGWESDSPESGGSGVFFDKLNTILEKAWLGIDLRHDPRRKLCSALVPHKDRCANQQFTGDLNRPTMFVQAGRFGTYRERTFAAVRA